MTRTSQSCHDANFVDIGALQVVIMTTCSDAKDDKVCIITTSHFRDNLVRIIGWQAALEVVIL